MTPSEADAAHLRQAFDRAVATYPQDLAKFISKEAEAAFRAWWGQFYEAVRDSTAGLALVAELAKLRAEVRRFKRGDFTPDEFQALCHHRDETPGCTRAAFEAGCREYQEKLFGPKPKCDDTPALTAAEYRVLHDEPHPSHVWNASILTCCVRCGEFRSSRHAWFACNAAKLVGKVEFCCECAGEYPASDLIAGEIYCPTCRRADGAPCA